MRPFSRFLTGLLVSSVSAVSLQAVAGTPAPAVETAPPVAGPAETFERPDEVSAQLAARLTGHRVEVTSARDETSTTYANPDGTWTTDVASGPIRARKNGAWVPIDLTLERAGGRLRPVAAAADVSFSNGGNGPLTTQAHQGRSLSLGWHGKLPTPEVSGGVATYRNVMAGADLEVATTSQGFSEKLVVRSRPAVAPVLRFPITANGLKASKAQGGDILVKDAKGALVAQAPAPRMWGASVDPRSGEPAKTLLMPTEIVTSPAGSELVLSPPASFFDDPDITYPITVDPSLSLTNSGDTWVEIGTTSSQITDAWLKVGTYDAGAHVARSLIKWGTTSLTGKHVLSATISLYEHHSFSCTASQMSLGPVNGAFSGTTVWTNQPTYTGTYGSNATFAKGYSSSCPDGRQSISVLPMFDAWADGALTNYGLKMWGTNEGDSNSWKKFCSANFSTASADAPCSTSAYVPTMSVTYNSFPGTPTSLSPATGTYTNDTTPTYTAKVTDPDGGNVHGVYYLEDVSGPTWIANGGVGSTVASGGTTSYTRTTALTNGHTYRWRVKGHDGTDWGPLAPGTATYNTFTIDTTAPASPVTTSTAFPANLWNTPASGTFSWTETSTDATGYYYGLDTPTPATWTTAKTSASFTPANGWHTFYVRSKDRAGNLSAVTAYAFGIGTGQITSPSDQDRTPSAVTLAGDAPSTKNQVTYKYHTGTNATTAFIAVPTADVTPPGSSTPITSWPQTRTVTTAPFSDLVWNVAKTLSDAGKPDGAVQAEACFLTNGASESCSSPVTFTVDRAAFGNSYAVGGVGPGHLSLLTGDYAVVENDVAVADLSLGRTHNTLKPAASGVFGPGWTSTVPGSSGGAAAEYSLEEQDAGSYVLLVGADGETLTYLKQANGTYSGIGDAADGSLLVKNNTTTYTLTDPDSATTVWTLVNGVWVVSSATSPSGTSAESTATFDHDTLGRLTRVLGAVPAGVTCTTTTNAGCRALAITYATSTTATGTAESAWGDYTGNVSQVALTGYDPATSSVTTTVVARYLYDSTGHLRAVWDPRITSPLKTRYTYDTAGRLDTVTPPGLTAWTLAYDSKGRVAHVTRTDPSAGAATQAVVYDVPLNGTGAPIDMSLAQTATWGQATDLPRSGSAVFPASHVPTRATDGTYTPGSTDWPYARITYLDVNGRGVNTAAYGAGAWQISTARYDTSGNRVWELSPGNRAAALSPTADTDPYVAALTDSAARADLLAGETVFAADGIDVASSIGPAHHVVLATGEVASARTETVYAYDEGKPDSQVYHLVTTTTVRPSVLDGTATTAADSRTTTTGYAALVTGDASGWTLRQATSESTDMGAGQPAVVRRSRYDSIGRVVESRLPASGGADAGTTVTTYYTTAANTTFAACGGHAEWAGKTCRTGPIAQPATGSPLPVTVTSYDVWLNPATITETVGSTTRVTSTSYDSAGRVTGRSVTVTPTADGGNAIPSLAVAYDTSTGLEVAQSTTGGALASTYDSFGRLVSYTDADGNATATTYDVDGRVHTVSDGKGTYTYTYDGTDAAGVVERRGLLTGLDTGTGASPGVFGAAYDSDGHLVTQTYPNGLAEQNTFDNVGVAVHREYVKDATTWLAFDVATDAHGQVRDETSAGSHQALSYDPAGRLTMVEDEAAGPCITRTYGYDLNSNRTSLNAYPGAADDSCTTTTTAVGETHTFDTANRITDTAYGYDVLGRTTSVPAGGNAGGSTLTSGYHADNRVSTLTQDSRTKTFALDPLERTRTVSDTAAATITNHYSNGGDSPSWIGEPTAWVRNVDDISGDLAAIQASDGSVVLQLTNLHGDVVAYVDDSTSAVGTTAYFESTEFGAPRSGNSVTPQRYGWLGAKERSSDTLAGLVLMGERLYNPATGRFLQTDPVPGGSANAYDYATQDPINDVDLDGRSVAPGGGGPTSCGRTDTRNFLWGYCTSNVSRQYWARTPAGWYVRGVNKDHCSKSPDRPSIWRFNFISACDMHDYGYDLMRAGHLYKSEKGSVDFWFWYVLKNGVCSIYGAYKERVCNRWAFTYYEAVKNAGQRVTERATERRPAGEIPAGRRFRFVAIGYGAVVAGAALFALVGIIGQGEGLAFIPFFMVTMPLSLVLLIVSSQVDRGAAFFAIHLAGGWCRCGSSTCCAVASTEI